ncbi:MAG: gamma-butyrobetaine hydroxylase-like domain-containing protein [Thalassotalea sp.]
MSKITRFTLQTSSNSLLFNFENGEQGQLSYEYLRVIPALLTAPNKPTANKKSVQVYGIENVGKHGYRFIFNDSHSYLLTNDDLNDLISNEQKYWQQYNESLTAAKMTREAKIDILNLS